MTIRAFLHFYYKITDGYFLFYIFKIKMVQTGLLYLLPFMLIFILFSKLGSQYNQKSGLQIFIALVLFFGLQFISKILIFFLILKYSPAENPKQTIVDHIFIINTTATALGILIMLIFYSFTKKKIKSKYSEAKDEINNLGKK